MTADEEDVTTMVLAKLLFETSLIESGFHPEDTKAFSQRVYELAKGAIGVTESLDAIEEVRAFTALQMALGMLGRHAVHCLPS